MKTVKQVSKLCGISVRTIQYYDKIHLLKPSAKTAAGYRFYSDADIAKLRQILFLKELDFRLKDIRVILSNPRLNKSITFRRQKELLCAKRQHLDQLIAVLDQLECSNNLSGDYAKYIKTIKSHKKELNLMNKTLKISALVLCLCAIAGGFAIYKLQTVPSEAPSSTNNTLSLHINQVDQPGAARIDAQARAITDTDLPADFAIIKNLKLPTDLTNHGTFAIYTKDEQGNYDHLANYETHYGEPQRNVIVSFATDHVPLRDYHFSNGEPTSLNGHALTIYQYEGTYFAEFATKNLFFDVEATGLTESEFTSLVESLLQ